MTPVKTAVMSLLILVVVGDATLALLLKLITVCDVKFTDRTFLLCTMMDDHLQLTHKVRCNGHHGLQLCQLTRNCCTYYLTLLQVASVAFLQLRM
jgi:hypothetical protein